MSVGASAAATMDWAECMLPPAEMPPPLAKEIRGLVGTRPRFVPRLAHAPWVLRAVARNISGFFAYIPAALSDRIALVVTQDNSCRYCYGMHRSLLRIAGHSEAEVDRIVRDSMLVDLSPADRIAVDYARRLSRCTPRPDRRDFERLVAAGFDAPVAVEVAANVAAGSFMNRVATLAALPPEPLEDVTAASYFRFIRPFLARGFRPSAQRPVPPPEPNDGPCARVVAALGDSPSAHLLRKTIDEAFASAILPIRTKALVLAVVARALDCPYGEREARTLLGGEGLETADVDEVLQTLSSRRLDAREARVVPFARETVRYQTAVIQTRMREVSRDLSPAEMTELIGTISLANAVCRLSVLLDAR